MGGDYDGDQMSVKPIYGKAATKELTEFMNRKSSIISLGGTNTLDLNTEGIQSLYNLTMCPDKEYKFVDPIF